MAFLGPPGKRYVGKPSKHNQWIEAVQDAIKQGDALSPEITNVRRGWWRPGMSIIKEELSIDMIETAVPLQDEPPQVWILSLQSA